MSTKEKKEEMLEKIRQDLAKEEKLKLQFGFEAAKEKMQKRKAFIQRLQFERREAGLDGVVLKAQEVANLQANENAQEEKLAAELGYLRQQEIKNEKMRQYLRENSHELKELERQLKAAYTTKILSVQMAENEARKVQEQVFEQKAREIMIGAIGTQEEIERRAMMFEKEMKEQYRRTLQDQIIEKERIRQEEYMAFMKEKKLYEDTIKKIKEEEEKEKADKLLMKQKVREEMEQFYKAREMWKARERILIDKENQRLEEIVKMKEKLEAERQQKKTASNDEKMRILEGITKEFTLQKKIREEKQEMLNVIMANEAEERARQKEEMELKKDLFRRREAKQTFHQLLEDKARKQREEKELDARFVRQMNLKMQEEEERERQKNEAKRQIRVNDRKYNEEKMKENIRRHAENLKLTQMAIEFEEEEERKREEMIEEERLRILKEHAPYLMGYFPKGCLKERDLEVLGICGNSPPPEGSPVAGKK